MTEQLAIAYAERRAKEKGYDSYSLVYKDMTLPSGTRFSVDAYNEIWLILHISWGLTVTSDYGEYCHFYKKGVTQNAHEHTGHIEIVNSRKYQRDVRFLQVILNTKSDGNAH